MKTHRPKRDAGNVLPLIVAVTAFVLLVLVILGLKYVRILGSYQEQRTAIDAAALAAAKSLSRIVVEDPNLGFISLSDAAPIGKGTMAQDGYYLPVQSINTVLGTIRLDMIVADYMQDPIMKQCAIDDYQKAMKAQQKLMDALKAAAQPGGTGVDMDGNVVNPTQDATDAYTTNQVRLTGTPTSLVPGSLKLSLGYIDGLRSNIPIPQPASVDAGAQQQQDSGYYKANVDVPYNNESFILAALGDDVTLVDRRLFKDTLPGLAYSIPTVVKCEADEQYSERDTQNQLATKNVHATSAAEIGVFKDKRPNPGAFTLRILDSAPIPEISTLGSIFKQGQIVNSPCDVLQTPLTGDYPDTQATPYLFSSTMGFDVPSHPQLGQALSVAFYDWVRRSGTNINVKSLVDTLNAPLQPGPNAGQLHQFQVTPQGTIGYQVTAASDTNLPISQNQWRAIGGLAFTSTNNFQYDVFLTDFVHVPGKTTGGKHAGEPLDMPGSTQTYPQPTPALPSFWENSSWPYDIFATGPAGGAVRPSYDAAGVAVDYTFRQRVNMSQWTVPSN
jgi:hypothetical protein